MGWGKVYDLLKLYRDKQNEHLCQHIRENIRQRKKTGVMETQQRTLWVNWEEEVGLCGLKKKEAVKKRELCCDNCFLCAYRK